MSRIYHIAILLAAVSLAVPIARAADPLVRLAATSSHGQPEAGPGDASAGKAADAEPTLDQKFQRRFPQPVRVGHLIGMPVLDEDDSTIGYVSEVVRAPDGTISLIVPYSPWLGWLRTSWHKRPVALPIKAVALLALQIDTLDFSRADFDDAPTWAPAQGQPLPPDDKTLIGLGRR